MIGPLKKYEMKTASVVSFGLHVAVLGWAMVSFSSKALDAASPPALPVDLVSTEEFSKLTKGQKDAKLNLEMPKPMVEKQADIPKPVEQSKPKAEEKKKPVETAKADDAPPPPPAETKPDPIADKLNKPEPPKPEAKVEPPKPVPPKKPVVKPQPKFDPDKIAALLDKRDAVREASAGAVPNNIPAPGANSGSDARLSQSEIDALKARLRQCWNPPVGVNQAAKIYVVFRVMFKKDGTIAREPSLVEGSHSEMGPALGESARRALLQCQPYTMLRPEHYDMWKDMEIKFDPIEMFG